MHLSARSLRVFACSAFAAIFCALPAIAAAAIYTVTSSNDSGAGSLRTALQSANLNPDFDEIHFSMPGTGQTTITLTQPLPSIKNPVLIDGTTQPGFAGSPSIMISPGPGYIAQSVGFAIQSSGATLRSLAISNFTNCITIGDDVSGFVLEGCYLGVDFPGNHTSRIHTVFAITVSGAAGKTSLLHDSRIGGDLPGQGNIIAGSSYGISATYSRNNVIAGNKFGIAASGNAALSSTPTGSIGITLGTGSTGNSIRGCRFGGLQWGVIASAGATSNTLQGNLIGLAADGRTRIPILSAGFKIGAAGEKIGGSDAGEGNVIAGCVYGLDIAADSTGTLVQGNLIGLSPDGSAGAGNSSYGIWLRGSGVKIGGDKPGEGNTICSSGIGAILVYPSPDGVNVNNVMNGVIQGNIIGLAPDQETVFANQYGIFLEGRTGGQLQHVLVGGTSPLAGNVICGNRFPLYSIGSKSSHNAMKGNLININRSGRLFSSPSSEGIDIFGATTDILIGGAEPGAGNIVTNCANRGVQVRYNSVNDDEYPRRITILGNRLYGNLRSGIDLYGHQSQVNQSPNDPGDLDDGPNGMQNYPVMTGFSSAVQGNYAFTGKLDSLPNKTYLVELYANASLNPIHLADQEKFIARFSVTTGADGIAHFTKNVPSVGA